MKVVWKSQNLAMVQKMWYFFVKKVTRRVFNITNPVQPSKVSKVSKNIFLIISLHFIEVKIKEKSY